MMGVCTMSAELPGQNQDISARGLRGLPGCIPEYCQIHINLTKGKDWIKIFSKSGRDSTHDRVGIHG